MGVDDRQRRWQLGRDAVVVGDEDVDPSGHGHGDLGDARRPGVDGHDHPGAGGLGRLDRGERQAVTLLEPGGHVRDDLDAERSQRQGQDRQSSDPVGVEVAEDEDLLVSVAGGPDARQEGRRVGQEGRVVEARDGLPEMPFERRRRRDSAAVQEGHDARRQAQPGPRFEKERVRQ